MLSMYVSYESQSWIVAVNARCVKCNAPLNDGELVQEEGTGGKSIFCPKCNYPVSMKMEPKKVVTNESWD